MKAVTFTKDFINAIEKIGIELEKNNNLQEEILDELKKQNLIKKEHFERKVKWRRDIR